MFVLCCFITESLHVNRYHTAFVDGNDLDVRSMICVLACLCSLYRGKQGPLSVPAGAQVDLTSVMYDAILFLVMTQTFVRN